MATDPVTLHWVERTGGVEDPVYPGVFTGGTVVDRSELVRGNLHSVEFTKGAVIQNAEVQNGDIIADFPADVVLDGRAEIEFEIEGRRYMQKAINPKLFKTWDAVIGGVRLHRTILLTPKK